MPETRERSRWLRLDVLGWLFVTLLALAVIVNSFTVESRSLTSLCWIAIFVLVVILGIRQYLASRKRSS